ncbi:MAG: hypothetical protein M3020_08595 [Myxococcota bacterium]|nr:hypothetical protein [Myxococcota bacterium]
MTGSSKKGSDMEVNYSDGKKLQLWVKDRGELDGISVFLNGHLVRCFADQVTHKFPLERPPESVKLLVAFGGNDGGVTAIVDVTDGNNELVVARQKPEDGMKHEYVLKSI